MNKCISGPKGALPVPNLMNFRKTSEGGWGHFRSEKFRCAFSVKKKGGVAAPHKISLQKAQHNFLGSECPPPPIRKFSENSVNLVGVVFPKVNKVNCSK